jgi:hypothetical protein
MRGTVMEKWESYEDVATYLLGKFASEFGLERVEGKQEVAGQRSGTTWEIDAKGFVSGGAGFVIVECRRHTTSRQNQERAAGLAYRIIDCGAQGGIIVSPLGLQEGAKCVATAENIVNVRLNQDSTPEEFAMYFLKRFMVGVRDTACAKDAVQVEVLDKDGRVIRRVEAE